MSAPARLLLSSHSEIRLQQIRDAFPLAAGPDLTEAFRGGRQRGLQRLAAVDAEAYARNRNHLAGAVTALSPYLRHGCLSLPETVADIRARFGKRALKLISELSYRDYFHQVWQRFGPAILQELETPKVALGQKPLPDFIRQEFTGLVCMDEIIHTLQQTGYVHNHARMWFAAYAVHWLKIDWRQAADWFEQQLLDGDIASNHLSWQWIASSFSSKPYIFNKENLQKFGGESWCQQCRVRCPFDASYEQLQQQLFAAPDPGPRPWQPLSAGLPEMPDDPPTSDLIWMHDEMLSPAHPAYQQGLPSVFVFDPDIYHTWPLKRLQFMADCLAEMPETEVWVGNTMQVLAQYSERRVTSQHTQQPGLTGAVQGMALTWQAPPALTSTAFNDHQLMRFSRYWKVVEPDLMRTGD